LFSPAYRPSHARYSGWRGFATSSANKTGSHHLAAAPSTGRSSGSARGARTTVLIHPSIAGSSRALPAGDADRPGRAPPPWFNLGGSPGGGGLLPCGWNRTEGSGGNAFCLCDLNNLCVQQRCRSRLPIYRPDYNPTPRAAALGTSKRHRMAAPAPPSGTSGLRAVTVG